MGGKQSKSAYWPWDQQPEENANQYQGFCFYRDMDPRERNLLGAYRRFANKPAATKHTGSYFIWAKTFSWKDRALEYDAYIEKKRQAAIVKEKQKLAVKQVRQIEISARAALEENAALAHSNIKDLMDWDANGVRLKDSKDLPDHVTAAVSKVSISHDRLGNQNIAVEMHPKVRPIDLEGQHFQLWESDKKQAAQTATNNFLDLLATIKSGKLDQFVKEMKPSLFNPPPGITITRKAPMTSEDIEKEKDSY